MSHMKYRTHLILGKALAFAYLSYLKTPNTLDQSE